MKKALLIIGGIALAGGIGWFSYRKFWYKPNVNIKLTPDWIAKKVAYNVTVDGKSYIEGTRDLNVPGAGGANYGKWNLTIDKVGEQAPYNNIIEFSIYVGGNKTHNYRVDFNTKTVTGS